MYSFLTSYAFSQEQLVEANLFKGQISLQFSHQNKPNKNSYLMSLNQSNSK